MDTFDLYLDALDRMAETFLASAERYAQTGSYHEASLSRVRARRAASTAERIRASAARA